MKNPKDFHFAVLIDADNIPHHNIKGMMEEITKFGTPTTKRIYGDWTKPNLAGWKNVLLEHAIIPIQQYSYTSGKNATDSAMIIDAMDILYSDKVNGFCIVSSDSDFTRLATRLRESGMHVIGIGEKKTPNPFIAACDRFIFLEILESEEPDPSAVDTPPKTRTNTRKKKPSIYKVDRQLLKVIKDSIHDLSDDDGWAFLGDVGNLINKKRPEFDPRNYGFQKLTPLMKSLTRHIEIDERETAKGSIKHVFVKVR